MNVSLRRYVTGVWPTEKLSRVAPKDRESILADSDAENRTDIVDA